MTKDDLAWVKKSTQQFKAENGLESSFSFSGKDKEDSENKSITVGDVKYGTPQQEATVSKFESSDEILRQKGSSLKILLTNSNRGDSQMVSANDFNEEPEFKDNKPVKNKQVMSPSTDNKKKQRLKEIISSDVDWYHPKQIGVFCMDSVKNCNGR